MVDAVAAALSQRRRRPHRALPQRADRSSPSATTSRCPPLGGREGLPRPRPDAGHRRQRVGGHRQAEGVGRPAHPAHLPRGRPAGRGAHDEGPPRRGGVRRRARPRTQRPRATSCRDWATPGIGCSAPNEDSRSGAPPADRSPARCTCSRRRARACCSTPASSRAAAPRRGKLNAELPFDARRIDAVVVSHAHIDHTGRLPLLIKQGFHNPIIATPATRDLSAVMLPDAAHIQESDFEFLKRHDRTGPEAEPLYNMADAVAVQDLMEAVPYNRPHHIRKHLVTSFLDAGHILGSASVDIRITEGAGHRLVFSGDIGRNGPPDHPRPRAALRRRSTPSSSRAPTATGDHESIAGARGAASARSCAGPPGAAASCSFRRSRVGRTQELVYALHSLWNERQDSRHADLHRQPAGGERHRGLPDAPGNLRPPRTAHRAHGRRSSISPWSPTCARSANRRRSTPCNGPAVIIAASGMAEAGRILHHLKNGIGDHRTSCSSWASRGSTPSGAGSRTARRR